MGQSASIHNKDSIKINHITSREDICHLQMVSNYSVKMSLEAQHKLNKYYLKTSERPTKLQIKYGKYLGKQAMKNLIELLQMAKKKKQISKLHIDYQVREEKKRKTDDEMRQEDIQALCDTIRDSLPNLRELTLDLQNWGARNNSISDKSLGTLCQLVESYDSLDKIKFDLFQWGYYNKQISSKGSLQLTECLNKHQKSLKSVSINMGRWSCEEFANYNFFKDQTVQDLARSVTFLSNLQSLEINLRSWAYDNQHITNQAAQFLFQGIGTLKNLKQLDIGLYRWGYTNTVTQQCLSKFAYMLAKLKNLQDIKATMEFFTNDHDEEDEQMDQFYEQIALGLFKSNYLLRVNDELVEHLIPEISELLELRSYVIKYLSYLKQKSNLSQIYRKEVIWDVVNTIYLSNQPTQAKQPSATFLQDNS